MPKTDIVEDIDFEHSSQTLSGRLYLARTAKGLSKKSLAMKLGVKKSTVSLWESGQSAPRANRLQTLAGILDVSIMWLVSGMDNGTHHVQSSLEGHKEPHYDMDDIRELKILLKSALARIEKLEQSAS